MIIIAAIILGFAIILAAGIIADSLNDIHDAISRLQ